MPILRLCTKFVQSRDHAISAACTIEPRFLFEFPSCIKVRNVRKELLQLRHHHQCRACSGKFANSEKLPSPWSGYGHRETPDLWSAPFKGFPNLESSHLSSVCQLRCSHLVIPLRSQIAIEQSRDCANVLQNLRIGCVISRLARSFQILKMRIAISRLCKFLDCVEHIHIFVIWCLIELLFYHHIRWWTVSTYNASIRAHHTCLLYIAMPL